MISVIVPTLEEEQRIERCLASVLAEEEVTEVLVVDGGSCDRTCELAGSFEGVRVLRGEPGRAAQMNLGAGQASGEVLWFVHADCTVQPGAGAALADALADPGVCGGAFRFAIDAERLMYRVLELGVRVRSELMGVPYGDQGLFVRRAVFHELGGYRPVPIMEDLHLVRALRRTGRLRVLPHPLLTSARRWERHGVVRTTLRHWIMVVLDWLGFDPGTRRGLRDRARAPTSPAPRQ